MSPFIRKIINNSFLVLDKINDWFKYLSLEKKVLLPIILLQGLLIFIFAYFSINLRWYENMFNANSNRIEEVDSLSARLNELGNRINSKVLTYRFEEDETVINSMEQDVAESKLIVEKLALISDSDRGVELIGKYKEIAEGAEQVRNELVGSIRRQDSNQINNTYRRWLVKAENIDAALLDLSNYNSKNISRLSDLHQGVVGSIHQIIILTILSTIFLIITLYYYLRRTVTRPVLELSAAANKMAEGELTIDIKTKSYDEIGRLGVDLKRMGRQLQDYYKELEDKVRRKDEELRISKELDKRKDDFISIASHELKTPITSMKIFTELLKRQKEIEQDERSLGYVSRIDDQIDKLVNLVSQLLDVSKIGANGLKLRKSKFYVDRLLKNTVHELEDNMLKHKIIMKVESKQCVCADKDRIQQVLINLLINAAKYSPNSDRIIVSSRKEDKKVVISVRDYGMGIPSECHDRIFEKFFRVYEGKDKTFPGLGMGLHIASSIVKKHHGKIWFESQVDQGSTFYFSLPLIGDDEVKGKKYDEKNFSN